MHIDMADAVPDDMSKAFAIPSTSSPFAARTPSFRPSASPSAKDDSVAKRLAALKCLNLRMLSEEGFGGIGGSEGTRVLTRWEFRRKKVEVA